MGFKPEFVAVKVEGVKKKKVTNKEQLVKDRTRWSGTKKMNTYFMLNCVHYYVSAISSNFWCFTVLLESVELLVMFVFRSG